MRRLAPVLAAAVVTVLLASGCDSPVSPPSAGDVVVDSPSARKIKAEAGIADCVPGEGAGGLPHLTLPCLGGGADVDLSTLTVPLLGNLWASNCGPCRDEMPVLQRFYEKHGDTVAVLGIDMETYPDAALAFARDTGATYPQLVDAAGDLISQDDFQISGAVPQTILVAADGTVSAPVPGELHSVAEVEQLVSDRLGVTL
ncbi:hypothetical protein BH11ACT8_BH11ACT8_10160 [soil metagenome]